MWATLTLMSALSMTPGQAGDLELSNVRVTYGRLGPTRMDTKFLPGDVYFVTFDVDGLQFKGGNAEYSMKMVLRAPDGKPVFESTQQDKELFTIQGGGRVTLDAYAAVQTDTKPGEYSLELTITDRLAKPVKTGKLARKFEVAEKSFGVVRVNCAYDMGGPNGPVFPSPGLGSVGQVLFLHFAVTGFDRDPKTKQPKLKLEMRMLDEKGLPTLKDPVVEEVPKVDDPVPEQLSVIPLFFPMALTKTGKFTVELTATDTVSKKTSKVSYPLVVIEPPK